MELFVYSPKPCYISNGDNSLLIGPNLTKIKLEKSQSVYFNLGKDYCNAVYHLSPDFCKNVSITDLYGDILCYPNFVLDVNLPYKRLFEKSIVIGGMEYYFSTFIDKSYKLFIGSIEQNYYELPFKPDGLEVFNVGYDLFLVDITSKRHYLLLFKVGNTTPLLSYMCDSYKIEKTLECTRVLNGIISYKETKIFSYNGKINLDKVILVANTNSFKKEFLPMVFLEKVRLSADYHHILENFEQHFSPFISSQITNFHDLIDFVGKFKFCLPPYYKSFSSTYAIINSKVEYIKFDFENDKIVDIIKEDFPI